MGAKELVIAIAAAAIIAATIVKKVKKEGIEGLREYAYRMMLEAEHIYKSGEGEKKLRYVVRSVRRAMPDIVKMLVTEETMMEIINVWFLQIKDLLDDGKANESIKKGGKQ